MRGIEAIIGHGQGLRLGIRHGADKGNLGVGARLHGAEDGWLQRHDSDATGLVAAAILDGAGRILADLKADAILQQHIVRQGEGDHFGVGIFLVAGILGDRNAR